jgi:predicted MFS family arabinose efflux permease
MTSRCGGGRLLAPFAPDQRAWIGGPLATAFAHTFMWAAAITLVAVVAVVALHAERAARRPTRWSATGDQELPGAQGRLTARG